MPGYWGPQCTLCPVGYICDGFNASECTTATMPGSSVCANLILCPTIKAKRNKIQPINWTTSSTTYNYTNDTCGCATGPLIFTLNFGSPKQMGGLAMQGDNGWIQSYFVEYGNTTWTRIGGLYEWDSTWPMITHEMLFPFAIITQFLKITIIDYVSASSWPILYIAALDDPCCLALPNQNCTLINTLPVVSKCTQCCKEGTYSTDGITCLPCPAGYICTDQQISECVSEYYCPRGSAAMIPCI